MHFHYSNNKDALRQLAHAGKLASVTIIDDTDFANEIVQYVKYTVLRKYGVERQGYVKYNADPRVIVQMDNEQNVADDLAYYQDMMRAADADGRRKVVIKNDSVGIGDEASWRRFRPALEYAYANGHFVGLHCYGDVTWGDNNYRPMVDPDHPGAFKWFSGRVFWLYDLMPVQAQPNFIATEAGCGGFQLNATAEQWLADVRRMDDFAQAYPWYKAFNWWTMTRRGMGFDRDMIDPYVHLLN